MGVSEEGKIKERGEWRCLERIREGLEIVRDGFAEYRGQFWVEGIGWYVSLDYENFIENISFDVVCL